jgi:predicted negative regulator of RcsB-dependent stress response
VENDPDMANPRWEAVKAFATRYRLTLTVAGVGLVLLALGIWAYQDYRQGRIAQASQHYQQGQTAFQQGNTKRARRQWQTTVERFSRTPYAGMARVMLARLHHESGRPGQARKVLEPLVSGGNGPQVARQMAIEELARLRWAQGESGKALDLLQEHRQAAFLPTYHLLRGDLLAETGQPKKARKAYDKASQMGGGQRLSGSIQRRLDGLAGGDAQ